MPHYDPFTDPFADTTNAKVPEKTKNGRKHQPAPEIPPSPTSGGPVKIRHDTLEVPPSPQEITRRDSLPPFEGGESNASWHNRSWLDSDFVTMDDEEKREDQHDRQEQLDDITAAAVLELREHTGNACTPIPAKLRRTVPAINTTTTRNATTPSQKPSIHMMGPCTCSDASLHDHSPPQPQTQPQPKRQTSVPPMPQGPNPIHSTTQRAYDKLMTRKVSEARMQVLFGDERVVNQGVRRDSEERLRVADETAIGASRSGPDPNAGEEEKNEEFTDALETQEQKKEEVRKQIEREARGDNEEEDGEWDVGSWIEQGVEQMVEEEVYGDL